MNDALKDYKQATLELHEVELRLADAREKYQAALNAFNKALIDEAKAKP